MATSRDHGPGGDGDGLSRSGRIASALAEFKSAWRDGGRPEIGPILEGFAAADRPEILRVLLVAELGMRAEAGESVTRAECLLRFPEWPDAVDAAFATRSTVTGEGEAIETGEVPTLSGGAPGSGATDDYWVGHQGATVAATAPDDRDSGETVEWLGTADPGEPGGESQRPRIQGRYRIIRQLGEGGFGRVLLAWDEEIHRHVALKVPRPGLFTAARQIDDFLREARMVGRVRHPAIVSVYDVGRRDDGSPFVVMEYVDGRSLADVLKDPERPPLANLVGALAAVAEAVDHAHGRGLVHRDLKPENILIAADGSPRVADFGLAVHADYRRLRSGEIAGTPEFMSPEQVLGETHRIDGRTDVWGLGVILYQVLTARRPFHGTRDEVFRQVVRNTPKAPRRVLPGVPEELERVCLKCMSTRMADRYPNAAALALDLRDWLERRTGSVSGSAARGVSSREPARLVPRGLRAFEGEDADFFLELIPGPRDARGLPEVVRFWKGRLEETDPARAFHVGLIYGPSGCGKSSLMKAGILPRLDGVATVYVEAEAAAGVTEARLLSALRSKHPGLSGRDLPEAVATLRDRGETEPCRKVVVVIDQFEQWLHARPAGHDGELVRALRQCDGRRVQCVLLVRDDFWMAVTGFLRDIEVGLVEGENSWGVGLFDEEHARGVLARVGHAFGRLPADPAGFDPEHTRFLDQAVAGLKRADGRIVPVRLSLFAEMMRGKPWVASVLRDTGGPDGLGASYLDETFASPSAPPVHRLHQCAARAVLKSLLPARDAAIKGGMRTRDELLAASGYAERPRDFEELMHVLDAETRLITPADATADADGGGGDATAGPGPGAADRCYQLTHDELVPSVRLWLTRRQRESWRGRAEVRLDEQAAFWNSRPEPRYLPSAFEWCYFRLSTASAGWTPAERRMMAAGGRRLLRKSGAAAAVAAAVAAFGLLLYSRATDERLAGRAEAALKQLLVADYPEVPALVDDLGPHRDRIAATLRSFAATAPPDSKVRLVAGLALVDSDPGQVAYLRGRMLAAGPDEFRVIRDALKPRARDESETLWRVILDGDSGRGARLRAASALAAYDPHAGAWEARARDVALWLVSEDRTHLARWSDYLRPVRRWVTPALRALYLDPGQTDEVRTVAALALADYLSDNPDAVSGLILDANPEQFRVFMNVLRSSPAEAVPRLERELGRVADHRWADPPPHTSASVADPTAAAKLSASDGFVSPRFAFAASLPLDDFAGVALALTAAGYRPATLRPYAAGGRVLAAASWVRDGRAWEAVLGKSAEEVTEEDRVRRARGPFRPVDLAAYPAATGATAVRAGSEPTHYAALWVDTQTGAGGPLDFLDARMYVAVPEARHGEAYDPLNRGGYSPRTNFRVAGPGGEPLYSSVRWKMADPPRYGDVWNAPTWGDVGSAIGSQADLAMMPVDARFTGPADGPDPQYASVWWAGSGYETCALPGLSPGALLARGRELAEQGFRPFSLAAIAPDSGESSGRVVTASVWRRPVVNDAARDALAGRQANAAAALWHLGRPQALRASLRGGEAPRLRSALITSVAALGVDPRALLQGLDDEADVSARRGLVMALAGVARFASPAPPGLTAAVVSRLQVLHREDPDPGVHAAAELALSRFGRPPDPTGYTLPPAGSTRRWYEDDEGHTLAILPGPLDFLMGSPGEEPQREHHEEMLHARHIDRTLAVGFREVTYRQFLRFDPSHFQATRYGPGLDDPVNMVSWFRAAEYCNWLSRRAGLPRDQWCYTEPIGPGMTVGPEVVSRTGYRLPTEAEWEYFCRAGTRTSRYYGRSDTLLPQFAVTVGGSNYRTLPVGSLLPNDFGLFDTLGNVMEWCLGDERPYPDEPAGDRPTREAIAAEGLREMRGGSFLYMPSSARAAKRDKSRAGYHFPYLGFRVVRTLPDGQVGRRPNP